MNIAETLQEDMKTALRTQEKDRLAAIRLILADVKRFEIDERTAPNDAQVTTILTKLAKQRRESITQYEQAQREDLAARERFELGIIGQYLPQALSDVEITALIEKTIAEQAATSIRDMGKVMAVLQSAMQGRADMSQVSQRVKTLLNS